MIEALTSLSAGLPQAVPFLQMWDGDHMDGWGWGGWLTMSIMMLLFWGGLVVIGLWLARATSGPHSHVSSERSALDLARERYARGEINDEEFERIRRGLLTR